MSLHNRQQAIDLLKSPRLWGALGLSSRATVSTGHHELDLSLPGGGWPANAMTEILHDRHGISELQLLLPSLARLSRGKHVALVAPPYAVNGPALASVGAELSRITVLPQTSAKDRNWAAEQCLRSGAYAAVLIWADDMADQDLRRLQLACEHGKALGFVFRSGLHAQRTSPAALRVKLGPQGQVDVLQGRDGRSRRLWWQRPGDRRQSPALPSVPAPIAGCALPG